MKLQDLRVLLEEESDTEILRSLLTTMQNLCVHNNFVGGDALYKKGYWDVLLKRIVHAEGSPKIPVVLQPLAFRVLANIIQNCERDSE